MFERCLYFNLNALTRKVNRVWARAFEDLGLSPAHAYLLRVVLEKPGTSQQAIATELQLEKSTVARFIESLEGRGYLRRDKAGREQLVYPSQNAMAIAEELQRRGDQLYRRMIKDLGKNDMAKLVKDLRVASGRVG
ncbi:MAG: hypothetical protein OI74_07885 [Gammaproteobacteria bacterium (ex Lamellibrachia satsuma)]|nr:MAG: MarR family transcriptional regulator [Gammaproteobacteria bacterium (ex Lamellibrachia satsuma)]RRS33389.1 MAG: hypothetical protein OI74_07885 [Gammaproteobacteria bacterium (ex Lamellibrachia satsuma)]RRS35042.1 MAG: hypothetical protein NV67_11515 [Gammaproteobacteria bacterium (ex Lamellibrachia satsuma)]